MSWCFLFVFSLFLVVPVNTLAQERPTGTSTVLRYCADPDWMPFEGVVDGKHTGIAHDYMTIFEKTTPFTFEFVPSESWEQATEFLKTGRCDLTFLLNRSEKREEFLSFTMPYFFGPNVLVTHSDKPFIEGLSAIGNMTVGIVKGYRLLEEVPFYYPNVRVVEVSSELDGLFALQRGKIDVYVGSLFSVNARLSQLKTNALKINGWISIQDELRIGLRKEKQSLIPIFNQAIESIKTREHNEILNRWSNVRIVNETNHSLIYSIIGIALTVILIFAWRFSISRRIAIALKAKNDELEQTKIALTKANESLEYISFHDKLTNLYNRHYFSSSVEFHVKNAARQLHASALLMIDIDFFKQINDRFGHSTGDAILKQFADILRQSIRAGDIAARWGGEEFIVLLPQADQEETLAIAQRIQTDIASQDFPQKIEFTVSIGAAQLAAHETTEHWIDRADQALYNAKHNGRNSIKLSA